MPQRTKAEAIPDIADVGSTMVHTWLSNARILPRPRSSGANYGFDRNTAGLRAFNLGQNGNARGANAG